MDRVPGDFLHRMARNYRLCLADFPDNLEPSHLEVPSGEQADLFAGLLTLHALIANIYQYFALLVTTDEHWADRTYCYQAIEAPVKLLWAMGDAGRLIQTSGGMELRLDRADLDPAIKRCGCRNPGKAFGVLEAVGFRLAFRGADGLACSGGYRKCATVIVCYPADNGLVLRALTHYAARLPQNRSTRKKIIFEVFLRADFRPLLPGYTFHLPHLPAEEGEVVRTLDAATLEVWRELTGFMARRYPQYRLFYRVPRLRDRGWVADYSSKENDYGLWSISVEDEGLSVRVVFSEKTVPRLLQHIGDLSPGFQEAYLTRVACKDCVHCGKHVFFRHGDHSHRLCKRPWYASPHLRLQDLPDIERLIDCRLAGL